MLKEADTIFEGFDEPDAPLLIHGIIDGYIELADEIICMTLKQMMCSAVRLRLNRKCANDIMVN